MKTHFSSLLLLMSLMLASCGDDNGTGGGSNNANSNTTEKSIHALRIEMPHTQRGNNYLLLVKQDDEIGVNYIIEWDCMKRAQRWTCWEWNATSNKKGWERKNWDGATWMGITWNGDPFQADDDIPAEYRTELTDYRGSGYDRGHICASEDRICSKNVNGQTFYLSNMHPQVNAFNSGVWAKMESRVRQWRDAVTGQGGTMYVCKGGTLQDVNVNGKTMAGTISNTNLRMPVPKYFFMAIVKRTQSGLYSGMAFWAEHKGDNSTDLAPYMISINELEARTGYDFFCNLPDNIEESMEGMLTTSEWK